MNFKKLISVIIAMFTFCLCGTAYAETAEQRMYVTADYLNVRSTPSAENDSNILKSVSYRNYVTVIGKSGDWSQIRMANGNTAYVKSSYLATIQPAVRPTSSLVQQAKGGSLIGYYQLTAYCSCRACCGVHANGITASGVKAKANHTIACNSLPFGTKVRLGNDPTVYTVEDTGGMGNNVIDVYMNSHSAALNFGRKYNVPVYRVN